MLSRKVVGDLLFMNYGVVPQSTESLDLHVGLCY